MKVNEPLIEELQIVIHRSVRVLAILMVLMILMSVADIAWTLYQKLSAPPSYILTISGMLDNFAAFMAVLIAIEIFVNVTVYVSEDLIHIKIFMATALMVLAGKVIILDLKQTESEYLWGIASATSWRSSCQASILGWTPVRVRASEIEMIKITPQI